MYVIPANGFIRVLGTWAPLVEISKIDLSTKSDDDRFFIKEPIPVPGSAFSRKSFKRTELEIYKASTETMTEWLNTISKKQAKEIRKTLGI